MQSQEVLAGAQDRGPHLQTQEERHHVARGQALSRAGGLRVAGPKSSCTGQAGCLATA